MPPAAKASDHSYPHNAFLIQFIWRPPSLGEAQGRRGSFEDQARTIPQAARLVSIKSRGQSRRRTSKSLSIIAGDDKRPPECSQKVSPRPPPKRSRQWSASATPARPHTRSPPPQPFARRRLPHAASPPQRPSTPSGSLLSHGPVFESGGGAATGPPPVSTFSPPDNLARYPTTRPISPASSLRSMEAKRRRPPCTRLKISSIRLVQVPVLNCRWHLGPVADGR